MKSWIKLRTLHRLSSLGSSSWLIAQKASQSLPPSWWFWWWSRFKRLPGSRWLESSLRHRLPTTKSKMGSSLRMCNWWARRHSDYFQMRKKRHECWPGLPWQPCRWLFDRPGSNFHSCHQSECSHNRHRTLLGLSYVICGSCIWSQWDLPQTRHRGHLMI